MRNKRVKLFLENFIFFGGLAMLTKALPIIMLPIITGLLTDTSNYGIADMFNVISNFGSQIAIFGMYDAMFREFFELEDNVVYQRKVTSTAFFFVFLFSLFFIILFYLFRESLSFLFFDSSIYKNIILVSGLQIFIIANYSILQAPTRIRNNKKIYFFSGIGIPIVNYTLTIVLIKIGYTYEAIIYATVISFTIFLIFYSIINRGDFKIKSVDLNVLIVLFKIGVPLVPTFVIYWILNSVDRLMIIKLLNESELGIYSVGARLASVSLLVYTAFSSGWQYFSFSTMNDKDQVELNSKIFEYLGLVSFFMFVLSLPFINLVFNLMFNGDYVRGAEVFPFLFLSPLFLMLFQTLANQFIIIKKSYYSSLSLLFAGITNLVLNYFFILEFGIKGAALATLISYIVSIIIAIILTKILDLEKIRFRFYISSLFILIIIFFKFIEISSVYYLLSTLFIIVNLYMYRIELLNIYTNLRVKS